MRSTDTMDQPVRVDGELLTGYGHQDLSEGRSYTGYWKNGIPHGQGVMTFPGGRFEGEYNFGAGVSGRLIMDDGFSAEGEFRQGLIYGQGKARWPDGCTYEGGHEAGKRSGFGTMVYPDGTIYEGYWREDRRVGRGKLSQPTERSMKVCFRTMACTAKVS